MNQMGRTLAFLVVLVAGVAAPPAQAEEKAPSRESRDLAMVGSDITLGDLAHFEFVSEVAAGPVDIEVSRSDARSTDMAPWEPYVTATLDRWVDVTVDVGQVICIRYRNRRPDDSVGPWRQQCSVRGWQDEDLRVRGRSAVVRAAELPGAYGVSLWSGGRLEVPDLERGMHVAAVIASYSRRDPLDGNRGAPRWIDPAGHRPRAVLYTAYPEHVQLYRVRSLGTGSFVSDYRHGARPIGAVVVFPTWYSFGRDERQTWTPTSKQPRAPRFARSWAFRPAPDLQAHVGIKVPSGWSVQFQVRRGSSLDRTPRWKPLAIPRHAVTLNLRLPAGQTICTRFRAIDPDGVPRPWSRAGCRSRPFDDSRGRVHGDAQRVADPYSIDGVATRLRRGSDLILPGVRKGSLAGYVFTSRGARDFARLNLGLRCGWGGLTGRASVAGWPSGVWARTRCTGPLRLSNRGEYDDVSALIVIPPWAVQGNTFPFA